MATLSTRFSYQLPFIFCCLSTMWCSSTRKTHLFGNPLYAGVSFTIASIFRKRFWDESTGDTGLSHCHVHGFMGLFLACQPYATRKAPSLPFIEGNSQALTAYYGKTYHYSPLTVCVEYDSILSATAYLITSGRGMGPMKPRQPANAWCQIPQATHTSPLLKKRDEVPGR